jgi:hypothetical protein
MRNYGNIICDDENRRNLILEKNLNGIDYVEVELINQNESKLHVFFIKPILQDLAEVLKKKETYKIIGGVRITNVEINGRPEVHEKSVTLTVNTAGDFSYYTLKIDTPKLDCMYSQQTFCFKAQCPSSFDCKPRESSEPLKLETPPFIDYMAKDYSSFRQALVDYISTKYPFWTERSEADLGMMLIDLFSYAADRLSYLQDTIANEAYLDTARQRVSVKRHAQFIDYRMHDGCNSKTYLYFKAIKGGEVPANTQVCTESEDNDVIVFETDEPLKIYKANNLLNIHTWGNKLCCLPKGTTSIYLEKNQAHLKKGDFIALYEKNSNHLCVIQLITVLPNDENKTDIVDPLDNTKLLYIEWSQNEALKRDFIVSTIDNEGKKNNNTEVWGNIIPASHGKTIDEEYYPKKPESSDEEGFKTTKDGLYHIDNQTWYEVKNNKLSFNLRGAPLTFLKKPIEEQDEPISSVKIYVKTQGNDEYKEWTETPTLLKSKPFDEHFVVDVDEYGKAIIRFGDGTCGQAIPDNAFIKAKYRIGCGTIGNVGSNRLTSLKNNLEPKLTYLNQIIKSVKNILQAEGGEDLETINHVKFLAPKALRREQKRAVTEDDYVRAVEELNDKVSKAQALFRWTGSWYTVFITIDPKGEKEFDDELKNNVLAHISKYKLAGYDVEICKPEYVPLEIEINICVNPGYFKAHVKEALLQILSNKEFSNGKKGFFHPDNFTFGQSVYLSHLYQAIGEIEGINYAEIIGFKRFGKLACNEIDQGYISIAKTEIVQLNNDLNYPEKGVLKLNMMGGK